MKPTTCQYLRHCHIPGSDNPDRFDRLITALRTAVDDDGTLDKESTPAFELIHLEIFIINSQNYWFHTITMYYDNNNNLFTLMC